MHINDLHSKQDVYKYFDKFDSDKDLEIDLKKEASKIPSEDRKLLQAMDKDHNGKVSLKEFLTSVQAQMGVSKSPSAASKLGIVSRSNIDAMDNPVIKVLKGFYDVLTGPGLVAQEVVPAVTAPQTPAKTVKTVALPAGTTKPTEVVKTADKISESILPKFDFYLSTSADPRALKTNQTRVGVRYEDLPNKDLSSRLTLMQNYGDLRFTFDNRRAENLNNFEKSLKGDKADSDSLNGNVVSANSPAFGGVLRGAVHKENPFVSRWDSQNFYRSGASFFGDKDTFTYYGPALTFGGELNKFNAAAVSFHAGTALDTKSKNVSIGSQNQYSLNAEYLHEMEGFSEFILRFSVGATAAITQRRTNVTTSNSASAAVTGATGSAPTTPAQRNPFFIDNQLDYDESARHWGVSPKVSLEGNHKDWKLNLEGDLQKYRAYQKSAAQNNFETMGRVLLSFEKPLGDFVIRVAYGYGEIGRQTETRANYYNAILYQQNAPIRKENAEIDEKNKKLPLNQKIEHKDYITLAGINDSKVVDAIDHTRTSSNVKSVSHIAELSVTYKVNPSVSFSAGVIQQFEPSNLQFKMKVLVALRTGRITI